MQLVISPTGSVRTIYDETIDLLILGQMKITRASFVEPDEFGRWLVDLSPVNGPRIGPFSYRSAALLAERKWLEDHWLSSLHAA